MKNKYSVSEVFVAFGETSFFAQLLEYDLISLYIVDSIIKGISFTRADLEDVQRYWDKKTLGRLLQPLKKSSIIPADLKSFLGTVLKKRNYLAHSFFTAKGNDLDTPEGIQRMIQALKEMRNMFEKAQTLIRETVENVMDDLGISSKAEIQRRMDELIDALLERPNNKNY